MDKPEWELVEDAGADLVLLNWHGPGEKVTGVPLGRRDEVAEKLADWLARIDFGEQ